MMELTVRRILLDAGVLDESKIAVNKVVSGTAPPYITYFLTAGTRQASMGYAGKLRNARLQFDVFAKSYSEAKALASSVQLALENAAGISPPVFNGDLDQYEDDTQLHHVILDYSFWETV